MDQRLDCLIEVPNVLVFQLFNVDLINCLCHHALDDDHVRTFLFVVVFDFDFWGVEHASTVDARCAVGQAGWCGGWFFLTLGCCVSIVGDALEFDVVYD